MISLDMQNMPRTRTVAYLNVKGSKYISEDGRLGYTGVLSKGQVDFTSAVTTTERCTYLEKV